VAKLAAGHTTLTGQILGTPAFMPPEQFTGAPIDGRADIFSLGVVLYWLATGEQAFPGESVTAVSYKVVHTDPVPPRKLNPSVPANLESIILKCLAKSPDERYQTGEDLARDLGELRTSSTAAAAASAATYAAAAGSDPNATLVETPPALQTGRTAAAQPPERAAAPNSKSSTLLVLTAVVIAAIAGGSWYILRHKETPVANAPPPAAAASETQSARLAPPESATTAPVAPPAAVPNKRETKPAAAENAPPTKVEAAAPAPPALDFNPKSLDPKANARLKIEAGQMPANLDFSVEMNGKLYLRRSDEGDKKDFDDLYVPPGVQEFRVIAESGSVRKSSNTVSAEFKAKKRHTLKVELRTQGASQGAGTPQGLYADTQIVLTLK
jgi:serine/threonine-protein kinase